MSILLLILIIAAVIGFGVIGILVKIGLATVKFFLTTSIGAVILVVILIYFLLH